MRALLLFLVLCIVQARISYDGHVVFRLHATQEDQLETLETLKRFPQYFDFWTPLSTSRPVDMRSAPAQVPQLKLLFSDLKIDYEILIDDVQQAIHAERPSFKINPEAILADDFYQHYHTYDENIAWLKSLASSYPTMTELISLGDSYEGREMLAIRVFNPTSSAGNKRAIWIDAGIHAREWITVATVNYILGHFLSDYHNDTDIKSILDNADLYVLTMFNPDGYVYSWTTDRMWRKTRSPNKGSPCKGTDANRNWDWHWDGEGSSTQACADDYRGSAPFSEIETKTVSNFLSTIPQLKGYINFHSYSQLWMYPWGYTYVPTSDAKILDQCANASVSALEAVYGTKYEYGQISTTIYIASGNTVDWTYGNGVKFSMAVELRDLGRYGFLLPEDQIVPSGIETLAGFKAYAKFVIKNT